MNAVNCDGFRGGRSGSALPLPLVDGLTPSLVVMLANAKFWSFYCKAWYSYIRQEKRKYLSKRHSFLTRMQSG